MDEENSKHIVMVAETNLPLEMLEKLKGVLVASAQRAGEMSRVELDEVCKALDSSIKSSSAGSWSMLSFSQWDNSATRYLDNIRNTQGNVLFVRAVIGDRELIVWWEAD